MPKRARKGQEHMRASLVVEDDPEAGPLFTCLELPAELQPAVDDYAAKYLDTFGELPLGAHQLPGTTTIVMLPTQQWRPKRK